MFLLIEMTNVLINIYVPHGMFDVTKVIKVTRTLTYNYVPYDMSNVTKQLSYNNVPLSMFDVTKTLVYSYVPHGLFSLIEVTMLTIFSTNI
jgi:hypothetical protein